MSSAPKPAVERPSCNVVFGRALSVSGVGPSLLERSSMEGDRPVRPIAALADESSFESGCSLMQP